MEMNNILGRSEGLFDEDYSSSLTALKEHLRGAKVLVVGGAGSIGSAVVIELLRNIPNTIHVVDYSENELVELVRIIRSSFDTNDTLLQTFALDYGGEEFQALVRSVGHYDYVFNLAALKHVRSERDPYTLMRLLRVNIFNTRDSIQLLRDSSLKNYFCVSTDKAANPVNMMGASKRIMEMFLVNESYAQNISMARFANVAFSRGSLLEGFKNRLIKLQPLSAPNDVSRYFISPQEAGQLCLLSGLLGDNLDIFFPKLNPECDLQKFSDIAIRFLAANGYEAYMCESEEEARDSASQLIMKKKWPCYFFISDTTGEKEFEEFYTAKEEVDLERFSSVGIIKHSETIDNNKLLNFEREIEVMLQMGDWSKLDLVQLVNDILPDFKHVETGKNPDQRM